MSSKSLPKNFPSHFPKSKREEQELGKGKKDISICKKCGVVYWYKSWHHRLSDYPQLKLTKNIRFTLCPACRMINNKEYEGEIVIEDISPEIENDLINTISNVGKLAFERDSQDRIISIKTIAQKPIKIQVLTTENQLAVKIAKKIKKAFAAKPRIKYSKEESVIRVNICLK
ncbi:MAG: hypothetical protein CO144_01555 [Candidatus Nealsonbacteria bacterium CG_4_9_14_3_um_filter_35_11]|uniref:Nmd3 N-terminal domain-containing protein n=2 Tax=Candidatus Nealsoniibacteriota TaxID=1817911 RepID=A0A2M7DAN1_9BACT|nr:MAG: hypothetical protein COV62_00355 [Candidatus Nealsonbacteria bacterium CG11_big_fil_rev_8_21_14_0_20_35_11]PIV45503.1 MAG: hypothetical protein COS24_01935 [Candidatus Nealsonbacteria bacterium CG02_land_8_20_14_3_00_34_20]PIW92628.1 MAG: hypothetical protein COZ88_01210 [Candidatus Nealsonbacteria bacterium CG_4_8_14_3_um_filter_34_13]PIZ90087.1 MAG: hypothetical protein COX88_00295 [Candidatus Nealsonbacteria bacterium CG_4_10_14_0_2_um_filter_35_20]PJA84487.1 MAG: hypothetical protei